MQRQLRKVHKWIGLALAVFIVAQALSGTALTFRASLERTLAGEARQASGDVSAYSLDAALTAIRNARPNAFISRVYFPQDADDTVTARLLVDGGDAYEFVSIDHSRQYRVSSLGSSSGVMFTLFRWHEYLLVKGPGQVMNVLIGVGLISLALTGVYFWWPLRKRQGLKVAWRARPKIKWYDIHRVLGVIAAPFLVVSAITGMSITIRAFDWNSAMSPALISASVAAAPLDPVLALLASGVGRSSGPVKEVRFSSSKPEASFLVFSLDEPWPAAVDRIMVSTDNGQIKFARRAADASPWARVLGWLYPLHSGQAFGVAGQIFVFVMGLMLIVVASGGVWLWLLRAGHAGKK
ncbi:PepSY-associated TM helix domain-containing protein [Kordiimonas sp.]|uniref:PepSY-associated TM helix domain-containing protein n=1 Tax=Kordiimonas sp. TaxID=1970157 RepID=UPI003A91E032